MIMEDSSNVQPPGLHGSGPGGFGIVERQQDDFIHRPQYSMPGILHFLQTEWTRFEMERSHWEVEKAEMQARIAFLQGEKKGQECLKYDLVRRIKMLEFALKQERAKYHKLKYGSEMNLGDCEPLGLQKKDDVLDGEPAVSFTTASNTDWKEGRQLLSQYLQEIGYTDTIIDVRSARARSLLGLQPIHVENNIDAKPALVNGEKMCTRRDTLGNRVEFEKLDSLSPMNRTLMDTENAVMNTFDFLEAEHVDDVEVLSDENDDGLAADDDTEERLDQKKMTGNDDMVGEDVIDDDCDTEEALTEFDFLVADGERKEAAVGEWGVDHHHMSALKEQYRKGRHVKKGRPTRSALKVMLTNLGCDVDLSTVQSQSSNEFSSPISMKGGGVGLGLSPPSHSMADSEDEYSSALGLGELAGLTVSNEADPSNYDISAPREVFRKTWTAKYTLRSHFDGVRALAFHPVEPVLLTASEDNTVKLWNLQNTLPAKKAASLDVEPIYTFRAHVGPVLSLVVSTTGEQCYSGGLDCTIRCWNIPSSNTYPYDSYDAGVLAETLVAHTDAVWGLSIHSSRMQLLSCSGDGTVRLWSPGSKSPLLNTFTAANDVGVPTSIDFVRCDPNQMVASYTSSNTYIFDLETSKQVTLLDTCPDFDTQIGNNQINRVINHPTMPVTITAHEDRHIRFYDNNTGKMIHSMVAHLDAVTSLAVDPNGLYLLSGSHDSSIRLWNLDSKTCVQEITSHRKKFDESIHDVSFHPQKPYIASAGADALAKVFV